MASAETAALVLRDVSLAVPGRTLLANGTLTVAPGELVALLGPSGSGKTTALNVAAGVSLPQHGEVEVAGTSLTRASWSERAAFRLTRIGQVFQFSELLPELTVRENVALPRLLAGTKRNQALDEAAAALADVGMDAFGEQWPDVLSGGEAQRVAIARAIVSSPALLLADEPTGALDEQNSHVIGELFVRVARSNRCGVLMGTHDPVVAEFADRTLVLRDAQLTEVA